MQLNISNFIANIGYDSKNKEYYIFFASKYMGITDAREREEVDGYIKTVLLFIAKRKRFWALIYFDAL